MSGRVAAPGPGASGEPERATAPECARGSLGGAERRLAAAIRLPGAVWRYLREVSGDDAYERYLAHHASRHAGETPMTPKEYFAERQRQKWSGVTRCC